MSDSPPFVSRDRGELDLYQIWDEALPVVGLVVLFGALAILPYFLLLAILEGTVVSLLFIMFTQLVLAVGAANVLMFIISRAIQLASA